MKQVVLVTGGGSGIGAVTSGLFAQAGYRVVINDIDVEKGEGIRKEIERKAGESLFIETDISDVDQVHTMFGIIRQKYGHVDVLVNNAGVPGPFSFIADVSTGSWDRTLAVHLNGTFYCMREAVRMMMENGSGSIINIASIAGLSGAVGSAGYGAAKAAVINLTKTAAKELGSHGITVNAIAPGMVNTPTNTGLCKKNSRFIKAAIEGIPTGRMADPGTIAALTLFLCSPAAADINGQVFAVDSGASITTGMDLFMKEFLSKKKTASADAGLKET